MINKYLLLFFIICETLYKLACFRTQMTSIGKNWVGSYFPTYVLTSQTKQFQTMRTQGDPTPNVDWHFHDGNYTMRFHHVDLCTETEISGARARAEYHGSFQMRTFFGKPRMLKSRTPGLHMQRPAHSAVSIQKTNCYNYYHWVHFPLAATARQLKKKMNS